MITVNRQATLSYFKRIFDFLGEYYPLIIGAIIFIKTFTIYISSASPGYKLIVSMYWFIFITAYKDMRRDTKWGPFIILCIPIFLFLAYILNHGYAMWGSMLTFERKLHIVIDLNPIFKKIPFNDASFARIYKNETLTWFFRLVYNNGFVVPPLMCFFRSIIAKDLKKALKYLCSAHIFQVFIISPFYITFHLQEVWYVLGQPDGLARVFHSASEKSGTVLNCFPSMHTSISFAAFLLVLREKDKIFKTIWGFFCLCVIYSTMYLEIHWTIDVIGGLILAYCTVKLTDFVFDKIEKKIKPLLDKYYYKNKSISISIDDSVSTSN